MNSDQRTKTAALKEMAAMTLRASMVIWSPFVLSQGHNNDHDYTKDYI